MDGLEYRHDRLSGLEFRAKLPDHAFGLAKHDCDCDCIRRFGDTGGIVAFRGAYGDADELPRRREPRHQQDERIEEEIRLALSSRVRRKLLGHRIEDDLHRLDMVTIKVADMRRQPPRQIGKHVTQCKHGDDRVQILDRARRANLNGNTPARSFIQFKSGNGFRHAQARTLVQGADQLIDLGPVAGEQSTIDVVTQRLCLGGYEVSADPVPDRLERYACDAPDALVVGPGVDQEGLKWREEQPRRVSNAGGRLGLGTDGAAQFLKHQFIAAALVAAQQAALELLDKQQPRLRPELPEIIT